MDRKKLNIIPILMNLTLFSSTINAFSHDTHIFLEEYDFIIIGAGTAGCTLANRLTEVPGWKVLLIEAGGKEKYNMSIPLFAGKFQGTSVDWKYKTKPSNKYCTGFKGHKCKWARGKVLGGSSTINYMIYSRGSPQDYDEWESFGNTGWGWDSVFPYFQKLETFQAYYDEDDVFYHGSGGNVNVEFAPFRSEKSKYWVKAAQQYGFTYGDYNRPYNNGAVSYVQATLENGSRDSANSAYLKSVYARDNLNITIDTLVTKLIFDETKMKVTGVEFVKNNKKHVIKPSKEVIVCAGTINSAQLLMLSGIGPKPHLESLNIPVIKDLLVGHNLMDHIGAGGLFFVVDEKLPDPFSADNVMNNTKVIKEWMKWHTGPLSSPAGAEAVIVFDKNDRFNKSAWPNIEILFTGTGLNTIPGSEKSYGYNETIYHDTYGSLGDSNTFMISPILFNPKSRGYIHLRNKNPKSHPIIVPNYLEFSEDLDTLIEAIKISIDISKQPALQEIGTKVYSVPLKECLEHGPFGSDAYFGCQARLFTMTISHPAGTCKMGPDSDPTAVVDPRLKVRDISNLRVVDASVMPTLVRGHINGPVFMIAEKAFDMIREDWDDLLLKV